MTYQEFIITGRIPPQLTTEIDSHLAVKDIPISRRVTQFESSSIDTIKVLQLHGIKEDIADTDYTQPLVFFDCLPLT